MVRGAGRRGQVRAGVKTPSPEGLTPAQQLAAINDRVVKLMRWQQEKWLELIVELREAGISVIGADEVTAGEKRWLDAYFTDRKSTRLTTVTNAHRVCRLMLEKKKNINNQITKS